MLDPDWSEESLREKEPATACFVALGSEVIIALERFWTWRQLGELLRYTTGGGGYVPKQQKVPKYPSPSRAIVDPLWKPVLKLLATNDPTSNLRLELWL
jgi:hypothetical protein